MSRKRVQPPSAGRIVLQRVLLHFVLLLLFWSVLLFVIIPLDSEDPYRPGSLALLEGERAYAALVRAGRPNLLVTLRGLNMAHANYTQAQENETRIIRSGNLKFVFDLDGNFKNLEILRQM